MLYIKKNDSELFTRISDQKKVFGSKKSSTIGKSRKKIYWYMSLVFFWGTQNTMTSSLYQARAATRRCLLNLVTFGWKMALNFPVEFPIRSKSFGIKRIAPLERAGKNLSIYGAFHVNCPSAVRERQIVLYLAHVYDTKTYLKNFMISISDVFFP